MNGDALILGYADELLAEYRAKLGGRLDLGSLEGRLAVTLEKIVEYVREEAMASG